MRYWLFGLLLTVIVAIAVMLSFLPAVRMWVIYGLLGVGLLLLLMLFRSVLKPAQTVRHGLDLISSQDFNNRLVEVGEPEADIIVKLFNTMIDKLRNERLHNLERESFLQLLIEASPMGVVMLDFDERISLVNPSFLKIAGLSADDTVVGRDMDELPSEIVRRMVEVPLGVSEELRQGDIRRYRCYHLSFVQSGFRRQFYLLESLTEEVMKAERGAYEKVIRIISHEVNNTMGGVRSVLDTLHELNDNEEIREVIESCDNRCEQMTRFISAYADVVKVPEPIKVSLNLNELVEDMVPFLQGITGPDISLSFRGADPIPEIKADISLLQQVIVNIVKNAAESIPAHREDVGRIGILTYISEQRLVLEINNNGTPISENEATQLFSPFFTTKREGRGIGLTLISEILNRHGATYSLRTGNDGITRFIIRF